MLACTSTCGNFIAAVVINSNPWFTGENVQITQVNHPEFLKHNSHICCNELLDFPVSQLQSLLAKDAERHLGEITDEQHAEIIQFLRKSNTITRKLKKKYNLI